MKRLRLMSDERARRDRWHDRWMSACALHASWSKDPKRGVGAVLVNDRQVQVAGGWNGIPRGVEDLASRYEGPDKAKWVEHAERNCLLNAAAEGQATSNCTLYSTYFPCSDCARAIIQAGVIQVVTVEPDWNYPPRSADWAIAHEMLAEAGVQVTFRPCNP